MTAFGEEKVSFHQGKASVHTSVILLLKLYLLPRAPYSRDLAPSDNFLAGGQRLANNEEVKTVVNGYFEELDDSHYKQCVKSIEQRCEKCIQLK